MTMERHIVGLGGGGDTPAQTALLHDYVLGLAGQERPRMLWVPTAVCLVLLLAVWLLMSRTVVGRHLYALGGNENAARLT